jgi:hypothetical protein
MVYKPVKGAPPIGAVLTPSMTRTYAGWSSRGMIRGHPGTAGIPIPGPSAIPDDGFRRDGVGRSRSTDSPNVIFPSLYYENSPPLLKEHVPVSVFSDNQMPVPALRPQSVIRADPYQARHGGQRQVFQPQVVQTWLGMKGTTYG